MLKYSNKYPSGVEVRMTTGGTSIHPVINIQVPDQIYPLLSQKVNTLTCRKGGGWQTKILSSSKLVNKFKQVTRLKLVGHIDSDTLFRTALEARSFNKKTLTWQHKYGGWLGKEPN